MRFESKGCRQDFVMQIVFRPAAKGLFMNGPIHLLLNVKTQIRIKVRG
jgi:hypothetical protein